MAVRSEAKVLVGAGVVALILAAGLIYFAVQAVLPGDNRVAGNGASPATAPAATTTLATAPTTDTPVPQAGLPTPQQAAAAAPAAPPDPAIAADQTAVRQLGAHVHGEGRFDIAFENGILSMNLVVPGDDIVGFEHPASSPEQQASLDSGLASLRAPLDLFRPDFGAACQASAATVDWVTGLAEPQQEAAAGAPATTTASEHAEFRGHYEFTCASVPTLAKLAFHYFDVFPNAQSLTIQFISAKGQQASEVDRTNPTFALTGLL